MTEPAENEQVPLFRDQAVAWAGGRRLGDLARVESATTTRLFRLLVVTLIGLVCGGMLIRVPITAQGTVVVDSERGLTTALFAEPLQVQQGQSLLVYVGASTSALHVRVDSVSSTIDHQVKVTGHVSPSSGPPRGGRAYLQTGSTSLLGFVVGAS